MARLFRKKLRQVGLPPGSLEQLNGQPHAVQFSVIEYSDSKFFENEKATISECLDHISTPEKTWIQIIGVPDSMAVASIGKQFNLHPLVLEDILTAGQRSKLDIYGEQVFLIVRLLRYIREDQELRDDQVSIVFGPNYLISFLECEEDVFKPIKDRLKLENSRFRTEGTDYLAYSLIDTIVDYYLFALEKFDIHLDHLEEKLIYSSKLSILQSLQHAKRELIVLRKAAWPMREVINKFMHLESKIVKTSTQVYLRDVYDHTIQTIDMIEGMRDVLSGMLDIYLSSINIRTNDIMKVLTIVSTIFVPLTFITGIYGMNFDYMPELHWHFGYPVVLSVMVLIAIGMLFFFRHKKWLSF
jgi:magnesium transporter